MTNTTTKQCTIFNSTHIIIIALLVVNIIVTVRSSWQAEKLEMMKVGGQENWSKLQTIMNHDMYKAQYSENFDMLLQQLNNDSNGFDTMFDAEINNNDSIETNQEELIMEDQTSYTEDDMIDDTIDEIDANELN